MDGGLLDEVAALLAQGRDQGGRVNDVVVLVLLGAVVVQDLVIDELGLLGEEVEAGVERIL